MRRQRPKSEKTPKDFSISIPGGACRPTPPPDHNQDCLLLPGSRFEASFSAFDSRIICLVSFKVFSSCLISSLSKFSVFVSSAVTICSNFDSVSGRIWSAELSSLSEKKLNIRVILAFLLNDDLITLALHRFFLSHFSLFLLSFSFFFHSSCLFLLNFVSIF